MGRKAIAGLMAVLLLCGMAGCGRVNAPPEETTTATEPAAEMTSTDVVIWTPEMEEKNYMEKATFAAGPWQNAYAAFLRDPANYKEEDPYHAYGFVLADFNNDGSPELILVYGDDHQGGALFANIYTCRGTVRIVGQQIDMFYKGIYPSMDPSFPGVFVEGGRSSNFSCNYWMLKNNKFVNVPLWTDVADMETHGMVYTELTDNKQLIAEAEKVSSLHSRGVKFSTIDEDNIQMMLEAE